MSKSIAEHDSEAIEAEESDGEWIHMTADMELIEETIQAAQAQDMGISEYLKMCHEEYTGTVTN